MPILSFFFQTTRTTLTGGGVALWLVLNGHPVVAAIVLSASLAVDAVSFWIRRPFRSGAVHSAETDPSKLESDPSTDPFPLSQALDRLPGVFYVIGPNGRVIQWNERFESVSGYRSDELRDSLASRFFEGDDKRRVAEAVLRVFAVGDTRVEAPFITKGGDAIPMLFSGSRIDIDGSPYLVGMGIDVADRIAAEEALREREMEYRMLAENVIDVVSYHAADNTRLYVSSSIEDLAEYTPKESTGRSALDTIHPDDREEVRRTFGRALESNARGSKEGARVKYRMRHKDGSWIWVESVGRCIHTDQGEQNIVATTRDISSQMALEEQLRNALRAAETARGEAERAEQLKSLFLANMSHEIRTPLTSIIGFAEVLAGEVSASHAEMAELVGKSGRRLLDTIDSVLTLSKLEAGRWNGDFERVALNDEIRTTVDLLRPQSAAEGVPIHVDVPDTPVYASVDRAGLQRIIDNLLSNAIKFSPAGRHVHVRLREDREEHRVVLEVEDDGPGIPKSQQSQLFSPFAHMLSERDPRTGAGLGLSIVQRFVSRMKGQIDVESEAGAGTRFIVTLPHVDAR